MLETRTPYSTVDELFRNVTHAAPKPMPLPLEVCEAMDIVLSINVVATVIGLTGAANPRTNVGNVYHKMRTATFGPSS